MTDYRKTVNVPELDHDAMMLARFGHKVGTIGRIERRVVAALCAYLDEHGWRPCKLYDGETITPVHDAKSAMELIFNLDDSWLYFTNGAREHWVRLVRGNSGWDLISDYSYASNQADNFEASMEAFNGEDWA